MKKQLLEMLLTLVLGMMKTETIKAFADIALDFIEDMAAKSSNKWDDAVVLPMCAKVREAFDIPDDDEDLPENTASDDG